MITPSSTRPIRRLAPSTSYRLYPPVSIGELPLHEFQVDVNTVTETVVARLEKRPELPGVVLAQNGTLHSMIPRNRLFERLGHRYGVELFLRKPIIELQENLGTKAYVVSSHKSVKEAADEALRRVVHNLYEPLVLSCDDNVFRMLDMRVLLQAQSLILKNANNIIGNLNRIEKSIKEESPFEESLNMIIDSVQCVAPYHYGSILVNPSDWTKLNSRHPVFQRMSHDLFDHKIVRTIIESGEHVYVEDVCAEPHWSGLESLGAVRAWLGTPVRGRDFSGIFSLGRATPSPFRANEIDIVNTFSNFIGAAISKKRNFNATISALL